MILEAKKTTLAYRCPACGANVVSMVGIFSLSGDMIRLKCSCGGSAMAVTRTDPDHVRLDVPCVLCDKPHRYSLSTDVFFGRELFSFACTYSGLDICFVGSEEAVQKALVQADEEFLGLLHDAGVEDFDKFLEGRSLYEGAHLGVDPQVEDVVRYMLYELAEDDRIHCHCPDPDESTFSFEITPDAVSVSCDHCGWSTTVPLTGLAAADAFLSRDSLDLDDPPVPDFKPAETEPAPDGDDPFRTLPPTE